MLAIINNIPNHFEHMETRYNFAHNNCCGGNNSEHNNWKKQKALHKEDPDTWADTNFFNDCFKKKAK